MGSAIYSYATHLRAGEIIVRRINCQSLTFEITITVYTDLGSDVLFGSSGILRFGDGSDPDNDGEKGYKLSPIENKTRSDLPPLVGIAEFKIIHTYGAPGKYTISYYEKNRNEGVLNIENSIETEFFIETEIIIDPFLGCNNSPVLLIPPVDRACVGVAFFHNPGAYDPEGDSLSFEIVTPKKDVGTDVDNYRSPINQAFYVTNPYLNEDNTGPPEFS
ncbi:MAG: hypothetical protein OEY34_03440, partial [Cyclobacteriaceae bacterium]|nr:hypothetical protein [Cyclobacteriaceae bacterium]